MKDCIKCKDCKHFKMWRTSEQAEQFGQEYECSLEVLLCPSPDDYCSKAEKKEEQNQSDDAVNRQAVLDAIRRIGMCKCSTNEIEAVDECRKAVEALPPVTPKLETVTEFADRCRECGARYGKLLGQKSWIPVSKRLPEDGKTVIASTKDGVYPETRYTKDYGWEWAYEAGVDYWVNLEEVEAWMPLPKRYKPQESKEG